MAFEVGHELIEGNVVEIHTAVPPELALNRLRTRQHRPRAVADRLIAEHAMQENAQAPFDDRIGDEEQMATSQLRGKSDRKNVCQLALREVRDVVVLTDDEALAPSLGPPYTRAARSFRGTPATSSA